MKTVLYVALSFAGLFGLTRALDYAGAVNASHFEKATHHSYASLCAQGIESACPIAHSITTWGIK